MTPGRQNDLLAAALAYAARGWHVVPQLPRGKKAWLPEWPDNASTDPETIREWWRERPASNIGILTGRSGLVVLDVDGPEGAASFAAYPEDPTVTGFTLPPTLTNVTGHGFHMLYAVPDGRVGKNTRALDGWPGLEVKGGRSLVTVPPSLHPSGHVYRWAPGHDGLEPSVAPACLLAPVVTVAARPVASRGFPSWDVGTPYGRRALHDLLKEMLEAKPGARHATLYRVGCRIAELVAAGHLDDGDARHRLHLAAATAWADEPGSAREIEGTISDCWRKAREVPA